MFRIVFLELPPEAVCGFVDADALMGAVVLRVAHQTDAPSTVEAEELDLIGTMKPTVAGLKLGHVVRFQLASVFDDAIRRRALDPLVVLGTLFAHVLSALGAVHLYRQLIFNTFATDTARDISVCCSPRYPTHLGYLFQKEVIRQARQPGHTNLKIRPAQRAGDLIFFGSLVFPEPFQTPEAERMNARQNLRTGQRILAYRALDEIGHLSLKIGN